MNRATIWRTIKGFTLIELLIVVAIIAILAAIAVPNFLEAQVRSKVSRAMSDMRAVVMALESYYVDNNKYMSAFPDNRWQPGLTGFFLSANVNGEPVGNGRPLTTPIAYITSAPIDAFFNNLAKKSEWVRPWGVIENASYFYVSNAGQQVDWWWETTGWIYDIGYMLNSPGPDLFHWSAVVQDRGDPVYDPTNGTVSLGDIWILGKSHGFLGGTVR